MLRIEFSFKPYYKWITFNTSTKFSTHHLKVSFKPYYKWITFNTQNEKERKKTL